MICLSPCSGALFTVLYIHIRTCVQLRNHIYYLCTEIRRTIAGRCLVTVNNISPANRQWCPTNLTYKLEIF